MPVHFLDVMLGGYEDMVKLTLAGFRLETLRARWKSRCWLPRNHHQCSRTCLNAIGRRMVSLGTYITMGALYRLEAKPHGHEASS